MSAHPFPYRPAHVVLAENLTSLMLDTPNMSTQMEVSARSGVGQSSISNMLKGSKTGEPNMHMPRLDQVDRVARAFGLSAWQLLLDRQVVGKEFGEILMRPKLSQLVPAVEDTTRDVDKKKRARQRSPA